ncbi:MAG: copper resistance protein [Actinomycetota bacterium]|jgi:methionine-rich copper-binding protein CopC|nr:copper resistance protein [Actinomycetota bacterium]
MVSAAALLVGASPASAHASLVRAVPGDGSTVTTAPRRVQLVFDESLRTPADLVVTGPSGNRVEQGAVQVLGNVATIGVDVRAAGRYTVAFRVVSADGHPIAAKTTFRFAPGGTAQPAGSSSTSSTGESRSGPAGLSRAGVMGIVAGVALVGGLALLTVRRLPGSTVNPRGKASP